MIGNDDTAEVYDCIVDQEYTEKQSKNIMISIHAIHILRSKWRLNCSVLLVDVKTLMTT